MAERKDFAGFILNAFHREWLRTADEGGYGGYGGYQADRERTLEKKRLGERGSDMADQRQDIRIEKSEDEIEIDLGR